MLQYSEPIYNDKTESSFCPITVHRVKDDNKAEIETVIVRGQFDEITDITFRLLKLAPPALHFKVIMSQDMRVATGSRHGYVYVDNVVESHIWFSMATAFVVKRMCLKGAILHVFGARIIKMLLIKRKLWTDRNKSLLDTLDSIAITSTAEYEQTMRERVRRFTPRVTRKPKK